MATYVVVRAKGGTGREIVKRLLELDNVEVRAVVRDPTKIEAGIMPESDRLKLFAGDCTEPDKLRDAFKDASGVFFAASASGYANVMAVDQNGVGNVARLAKEMGAGRVVLISSQLTHPVNKRNPIRGILNTIATGLWHRRGFMDFKFEGEQALRHSGQEYCVVRPAQLTDTVKGQTQAHCRAALHVGQCNGTFMSGATVTRSDLAAVCVAAMMSPAAANCTFEVGSDPSIAVGEADAPRPGAELFANLDPAWDSTWKERIVDNKWTVV